MRRVSQSHDRISRVESARFIGGDKKRRSLRTLCDSQSETHYCLRPGKWTRSGSCADNKTAVQSVNQSVGATRIVFGGLVNAEVIPREERKSKKGRIQNSLVWVGRPSRPERRCQIKVPINSARIKGREEEEEGPGNRDCDGEALTQTRVKSAPYKERLHFIPKWFLAREEGGKERGPAVSHEEEQWRIASMPAAVA